MNRQAIFAIAALLLVTVFCIISASCGPSEPLRFLTYSDEVNGFSIDYPQGWDVNPKKSSDVKVAIWSKKFGINAAGILVVKDNAPGHTLKTFSDFQIAALPDIIDDYAPISTEELTVDGIPAIRHTYNQTATSTAYTTVNVYLVEDGKGWIIGFPCPQKSLDSHKSIFDIALDSFRLID